MTMMDLNTLISLILTTTWVSSIFFGMFGSLTRILFQRWSNKEWPHATWQGYAVAVFLGLVGGWLAYELPKYLSWDFGNLGAFVLGYFCPDLLENLLEGFKPPVGGPEG